MIIGFLLKFLVITGGAAGQVVTYQMHGELVSLREQAWRQFDELLSEEPALFASKDLRRVFQNSYPSLTVAQKYGNESISGVEWLGIDQVTRSSLTSFPAPLRTMYSSVASKHILNSFYRLTECLKLQSVTVEGRAYCLGSEFPVGSFIVKFSWSRIASSGQIRVAETRKFNLDRLGAQEFEWLDFASSGDLPPVILRLGPSESYGLVGIHIMAKNRPDWTWMTAWWSPGDNSNFAEDRPNNLRSRWLTGAKICVVESHDAPGNLPPDFEMKYPSLAEATRTLSKYTQGLSWCSNPYLEHGKGNARSNCIGCHQFAGNEINPSDLLKESLNNPFRLLGRDNAKVPLDYSWSLVQGDGALGLELLELRDYFETQWQTGFRWR